MFVSTVHESGEAVVGRRAGGHFKILREIYRNDGIARKLTDEEIEEKLLALQRKQATSDDKFHRAIAFGFKVVISDGEPVIKWHGFNSFKSTVRKTSVGSLTGKIGLGIIQGISKHYKLPSIMAHPIDDTDLILNPKYLDKKQPKYYRGAKRLWEKTVNVLKIVRRSNKNLGFRVLAEKYLTSSSKSTCQFAKAMMN